VAIVLPRGDGVRRARIVPRVTAKDTTLALASQSAATSVVRVAAAE
jgi:hypothetical protein